MKSLFQAFTSLRWQDLLDILLNSYILFRFYILFRGTNVMRMLIAMSMLWILERLAVSIGLIVTSWAIQGLIAAAALIIIIVFRNEIAGVFRARSFRSIFWGIPQRQLQTPTEIIADSVYELARLGLGALIALPLRKGIEDLVHGGIPWRGTLSREMLLSIFWHGTPVHDGAAIIQGNQIVEVAAIFPLSQNKDLPSSFGTRHRAAAGLAEQSDALVIAVSEERGEVTVFKERSIVQVEDSAHLNRLLQQHAGTGAGESNNHHQRLALSAAAAVCLVVITGIWFSFARGFETLATLEVPVEFVNRDPNMELFSASESSVKLQIGGSGSLIRSVKPGQVKVRLNLANAVAGNNRVVISRDGIVLPPGIELKRIEPQSLEVNLDLPARKRLPVQPDWIGKLPSNLYMTEAYTVPATVEVVGGELTLAEIKAVYTEKLSLDNMEAGEGTVSTDLVLTPSSLKLADPAQQEVKVGYRLAERAPAATTT